jgi:hypothetical protein
MRPVAILLSVFLLFGCAPSISCSTIENPPFGDRLSLAKELPVDGPISQKWIEQHAAVLESCGYK